MSIAPTREPATLPAPDPAEVLIKEARRRGRRRDALRAVVVLVVVALVTAVLFVALAARPSGSSPVTTPSHPLGGAPVATLSSTGLSALPPGVSTLGGVACSSPSACVVVGAGGIGATDQNLAYRTVDGGAVWTRAAGLGTGGGTGSVACTSATCVSAGGVQRHTGRLVVDRSDDGGATWVATTPPIGSTGRQIDSTACPTAAQCLLTTGRAAFWSPDAGATWHQSSAPGARGFGSLACASSTVCVATARELTSSWRTRPAPSYVMRSTDAGRNWTVALKLSSKVGFVDATCPTSEMCALLELTGVHQGLRTLVTTDAGISWASHRLPLADAYPLGLTCTTDATCLAWSNPYGNPTKILRTANGGLTWTPQPDPHPTVVTTAITCSTSTSCELIGQDTITTFPSEPTSVVMGSSDGGRSWSSQALPLGVLRVTGMACTTLVSCVVATRASVGGAAFRSPDGGVGWAAGSMPPATAALTAITCPTSTFCAASANGIVTSHDDGATWSLRRFALGEDTLSSISCTSATACVLVGGHYDSEGLFESGPIVPPTSLALVWHGGRLQRVPVTGVTSNLDAVSCAGRTCVAVGGSGVALEPGFDGPIAVAYSHDGGGTWTRSTIPSSLIEGLSAVSCPTARVCVAAGQYLGRVGSEPRLIASVDGGVRWSVVPTVHKNGGYVGVACASSTTCVATGAWGERDKPFSVWVRAAHPGGRFTALMATSATYGTVGRVAPGVLFGIPGTTPADEPRVVQVP